MLRHFCGKEIAPAILSAIEGLPEDAQIVELKAGENMPITCAFIVHDEAHDFNGHPIPEYAWDGRAWREIGFL